MKLERPIGQASRRIALAALVLAGQGTMCVETGLADGGMADASLIRHIEDAVKRFSSDSTRERDSAVEEVASLGLPVVPHLRPFLGGGNDNAREAVIRVLSRLGATAESLLLGWYPEETPRGRSAVIRAIAGAQPSVSCDDLVNLYDMGRGGEELNALLKALWMRRTASAAVCSRLHAMLPDLPRTVAARLCVAMIVQCDQGVCGDRCLARMLHTATGRELSEILMDTWDSGSRVMRETAGELEECLDRDESVLIRWGPGLRGLSWVRAGVAAAALLGRRTPDGPGVSNTVQNVARTALGERLSELLRWSGKCGAASFPISRAVLTAEALDLRTLSAQVVRVQAEAGCAEAFPTLGILMSDTDFLVRSVAVNVRADVSELLVSWARNELLNPESDERFVDSLARMLGRVTESHPHLLEQVRAGAAVARLLDRSARLDYAARYYLANGEN